MGSENKINITEGRGTRWMKGKVYGHHVDGEIKPSFSSSMLMFLLCDNINWPFSLM